MKTALTELLGISHPILLGGMAWLGVGDLPAAVSEAGGLGIIGSGTMDGETVRAEIRRVRAKTGKPFGVNLQLKNPAVREVVEVVCQEGVAVVTTGAGDPRPYLEQLKTAGVKVLPVIPNLKVAKRLEPLVDGLVFEGMEAGGHVGYSTTMAMMSIILPEIKQVPVVVAGGIADGRGLAAAMVMGAAGVQMGTAFLLSPECPMHPNAKQSIIDADDTGTMVTGHSIKDGVRGLKNKFALAFYQKELHGASARELMEFGTGTYSLGMLQGDVENGSVSPGIICGMMREVRPAGEIVRRTVEEAERVLQGAPGLLG